MTSTLFLTSAGLVGLAIGAVAIVRPQAFLRSKGVPSEAATAVWLRQVGVLILGLSAMLLLVRAQPSSPALRGVLWGNAIVHVGLLPIEIEAWRRGVITRLAGIVPNSILHLLFAVGFVVLASR